MKYSKTDMEITAMKEEIYTHNYPELGRMPHHTRPTWVGKEAEGKTEKSGKNFYCVFTGKNGKVNKLSRFRIR